MVTGIQRCVDHSRGFEDQYVLIGGAACDVWLTERGLAFRATKHRTDVFRLFLALAPADRFALPPALGADLRRFLESFPPESDDWAAIRSAVGADLPDPATASAQLRTIFRLGPTATQAPE